MIVDRFRSTASPLGTGMSSNSLRWTLGGVEAHAVSASAVTERMRNRRMGSTSWRRSYFPWGPPPKFLARGTRKKLWWGTPWEVRSTPGGTTHATVSHPFGDGARADRVRLDAAQGPAQRVRGHPGAQGTRGGPESVHDHRVPIGEGGADLLQGPHRAGQPVGCVPDHARGQRVEAPVVDDRVRQGDHAG